MGVCISVWMSSTGADDAAAQLHRLHTVREADASAPGKGLREQKGPAYRVEGRAHFRWPYSYFEYICPSEHGAHTTGRLIVTTQVLVAYIFKPFVKFWKDMFTRSPVVNFKEYVLGTDGCLPYSMMTHHATSHHSPLQSYGPAEPLRKLRRRLCRRSRRRSKYSATEGPRGSVTSPSPRGSLIGAASPHANVIGVAPRASLTSGAGGAGPGARYVSGVQPANAGAQMY
jgi:hypothetical protein